jgi:hypothetical protein
MNKFDTEILPLYKDKINKRIKIDDTENEIKDKNIF